MLLGEMRVLSLIYSYVAIFMFCAVRCVIIICFSLLFSNYSTCVILIFFLCKFFCFVLYFVYSVFLSCFMYYFSFCAHNCQFPVLVPFYRPLPSGGNQIGGNKYHITINNGFHNILIQRKNISQT